MSSDQERDGVEMEQEAEESVAPPRGRGRPKKAASKSKAEEKSSDEPAPKRGRGRPPSAAKASKAKKVDDDAGEEAEDADKAPAKRRGRPPKAAAKEKQPEPESEPEEDDEEEEEEDGDNEDAEPAPAQPAKSKGAKRGSKPAKNGHANGDAKEDELEEDKSEKSDTTSDSRIKIVVEHCKSCQTYRRKAEDIITALKEKWSNIDVEYNPKPPRKGSFEINLVDNNGSDVKLWTGLELGPPRKLKFPEPEHVVEAMEKAYVPESA